MLAMHTRTSHGTTTRTIFALSSPNRGDGSHTLMVPDEGRGRSFHCKGLAG